MKVAASRNWSQTSRFSARLIASLCAVCCQPTATPPVSPDQQATSDANQASAQTATASTNPSDATSGAGAHATSSVDNPGDGSWWSVPYPTTFDLATLVNTPPRVSVKGNRFVDESGNTLVFHGVNISDPDKLARDGHWSKRHFEALAGWGADVVRIPVHPAAWRGRGKDAYFALLDDAVRWANELDLYVLIDWHSIGNLRTGMFQHPMHHTTIQETNEFWRAVAHRYAGVSTVAFYELFNEPTLYNGTLGAMTWNEWKGLVEEMISIIQAHDPKVIPLVGGLNWAYDLSDANKHPINRQNIAYVSHPYPEKTTAPFEKNWDHDFGSITKHHPLFATEIGYMAADAPGAHVPVKDDGAYGKRITDYLDKKGASWTAWCFEPDWPPQLIADWNYTPTDAGNHFRGVMLEKAKVKAANRQLVAEAEAAKKAALEKRAADQQAAEAQKRALDAQKADKKAAEEIKKAEEKRAAEEKKAAAELAAAEKHAAVARAAADKKAAAQTATAAAAAASVTTAEAKPVAATDAQNATADKPKVQAIPETASKPVISKPAPGATPASASSSSEPVPTPPSSAAKKPSTGKPSGAKATPPKPGTIADGHSAPVAAAAPNPADKPSQTAAAPQPAAAKAPAKKAVTTKPKAVP